MTIAADSAATAAWFTLAGALGGVLLTSAVALTTAILNHRWQTQSAERQLLQEHVAQLRQERREAYIQYWSAWNRFTHELREVRQEAERLGKIGSAEQVSKSAPQLAARAWALERDWREAADALLLVGGEAVVQAATAHIETTQRRIDAAWHGGWPEGGAAYRDLNDAMRAELLQPAKPRS
jgi:hypothetical protein